MKKYSLYISLLMLLFAVSSCQDFLDRPPYDSIPDTEYWQNEEHIRTYAYGFYPTFFVGYGTSGLISGSLFGNGDTFNDDIAWNVQGEFTPIRIPDSDGGWSFATVRKANYMLDKFSVSDNYNALFSSDDLMSNPEVIFYRKYLGGILTHCTLTYNNAEAQTGASRALMEAYLTSDGLPVHMDDSWAPKTADEFFANRDPRLTATFRKKFYIRGEDCTPFNYSTSGYSMCKFMDDSQANSEDLKYRGQNNETDCPLLRLGEVLVNYAEARYELGELTQDDLNNSINLLRSRKGMSIPKLEIIGNEPAVNGVVYDDPKRDKDVPSLLWEIRRERRVEMCFEGLRYSDLKRWKKLDYMCNETNPDIRYGAYIRYSDYPKANKTEVYIDGGADEGFILCNRGTARKAPTDKNYVKPIPKDQIQLYKDNGYTLTQTKEWQNEE